MKIPASWPETLRMALLPATTPAWATANPATESTATEGDDRAEFGPTVFFTGGFGGSSGGDKPKRTVRAQRRSKAESSAADRDRAEAGRRDDRPGGGGGLPPSGGGMGPTGGGGLRLPGRGGGCGGIGFGGLLVLALVAYFLWTSFMGGGGQPAGNLPAQQGSSQTDGFEQGSGGGGLLQTAPIVMATPRPPQFSAAEAGTTGTANTAGGDRWLIMLYADADDKVLEQDIFLDINEVERIGSTDNVQIVAQLDRYRGGFQADGDWSSTKRFYITRDDDLNRIGSQEIADLGEANMADPQTLFDFVTWAIQEYPADKHVLIMSDHGMGWPGGWSDPTAQGGADRQFPLSQALGDMLYLHEIDAALTAAREQTGIDKFELVGMDACLMGHVEVFTMLEPHARYAVASQETEPALGWAYTAFLEPLVQNPSMTGADLGQVIVQTYIDGDQRIVDENARAEFVGGGRPLGGLFGGAPPAESVARQLSQGITLTAADLSALPELNARLNDFALRLQEVDPRAVAQARQYSQSFTSIFGSSVPPAYLDLSHFAQLTVQATQDANLNTAAQALVAAINNLVVANKNGPGKPGATGVSVYFPNSQLYQSAAAGPNSYNVASARFIEQTLWDEYLEYFYYGRPFQAAHSSWQPVANTQRGLAQGALRAPGAGGINLSPIQVDKQSVAIGDTILMQADVTGAENIGYIKLLVGLLDPEANSVLLVDSDYLEAGETRELNGVYYPNWGEGAFSLEFEWEPFVRGVTDGDVVAEALFEPESYGRIAEEATYTVDGVYTYADGEQRYATATFRDGVLQYIFTYNSSQTPGAQLPLENVTGASLTGAPWEVVPEAGDTFMVFEEWLDLDANGVVVERAYEQGETLTFGSAPLRWEELNAAAGQYVIGFIVEDLDGNEIASYAQVVVE